MTVDTSCLAPVVAVLAAPAGMGSCIGLLGPADILAIDLGLLRAVCKHRAVEPGLPLVD